MMTHCESLCRRHARQIPGDNRGWPLPEMGVLMRRSSGNANEIGHDSDSMAGGELCVRGPRLQLLLWVLWYDRPACLVTAGRLLFPYGPGGKSGHSTPNKQTNRGDLMPIKLSGAIKTIIP